MGSASELQISSAFSFPCTQEFLQDNIRVKPDLDPLGCLGDLGWYNTRIALLACGWEAPKSE